MDSRERSVTEIMKGPMGSHQSRKELWKFLLPCHFPFMGGVIKRNLYLFSLDGFSNGLISLS